MREQPTLRVKERENVCGGSRRVRETLSFFLCISSAKDIMHTEGTSWVTLE